MLSLALTDAVLFCCTAYLASLRSSPIGYRLAFGVLALAALLGALKFSGLYPLDAWHRLFAILSGSAALPLLAVCVRWPQSATANDRQFALIFLGGAALLGLAIAGLGKLRIYDQALGAISMVWMLWLMVRRGDQRRSIGVAFMLAGSVLFLAKARLSPWLAPGDFLHMGMVVGLVLLAPAPHRPATRIAAG
jgi:hypothetical protein